MAHSLPAKSNLVKGVTMRVVIKVQRKDGQYAIQDIVMPDDLPIDGVMLTKEAMVIGNMFRSMYGQVQIMPDKREADEL
jgi:hypothetical protein